MDIVWESRSEADTAGLAQRVATLLRPGDVLRLNGPLGAGKTRFVQGLAAALGTGGGVVSPTFSLIHEYDGPVPLIHIDAYRLRDSDEFRELGGEELLVSPSILCIEWADRIADVLLPDALWIDIQPVGPTARRLRLSALAGRGHEIVDQLAR